MLRIKDNVNLKELEKFGFEYRINDHKEQWVIIEPCKPKPYPKWHDSGERANLAIMSVYKVDRILTHLSHKNIDNNFARNEKGYCIYCGAMIDDCN